AADNTRVEPFARLAWSRLDSGALTETGGIAALTAAKQNNQVTITQLGLRASHAVGGKTTLSGSAAWQVVGGDQQVSLLAGIPAVGQLGNIGTVSFDKHAVALQADVLFQASQRITLGVGYSGVMGANNSDHGARATLTVGF
ncbi:MAG: autotransporter outer membrane beta-barrel domain-containing protein, partial [Sphingomonadales bacterium]